jgi:hypothetical protein
LNEILGLQLINPPSGLGAIVLDFNEGTGVRRPPFRIRHRGIFLNALAFGGLCFLGVLIEIFPPAITLLFLLLFLSVPHIALGIAWATWGRWSSKFQAPRLRPIVLFSGLLACSLNLAVFWVFVIWLNHQTDLPSWWEVRDKVEGVCDLLIGVAILSAVFGRGPARWPVLIAAVAGWTVQIVQHVGIL